jgi:hypothetical protein
VTEGIENFTGITEREYEELQQTRLEIASRIWSAEGWSRSPEDVHNLGESDYEKQRELLEKADIYIRSVTSKSSEAVPDQGTAKRIGSKALGQPVDFKSQM